MNEPYLCNVPAQLAGIQPKGDFVLVKRLLDPTERPSGLHLLPSTANPRAGNRRGVVLAAGPGDPMLDASGNPSRKPMHVAAGDEIIYSRVPANEVRIEQEVYEFIHEEQHVLCVIDRPASDDYARQYLPPVPEPEPEEDEPEVEVA